MADFWLEETHGKPPTMSSSLQMEGVMGYYDHEDIPGENEWGAVIKDEEIFASEVVTCIGQQIAIVAAETEAQARSASWIDKTIECYISLLISNHIVNL